MHFHSWTLSINFLMIKLLKKGGIQNEQNLVKVILRPPRSWRKYEVYLMKEPSLPYKFAKSDAIEPVGNQMSVDSECMVCQMSIWESMFVSQKHTMGLDLLTLSASSAYCLSIVRLSYTPSNFCGNVRLQDWLFMYVQ